MCEINDRDVQDRPTLLEIRKMFQDNNINSASDYYFILFMLVIYGPVQVMWPVSRCQHWRMLNEGRRWCSHVLQWRRERAGQHEVRYSSVKVKGGDEWEEDEGERRGGVGDQILSVCASSTLCLYLSAVWLHAADSNANTKLQNFLVTSSLLFWSLQPR